MSGWVTGSGTGGKPRGSAIRDGKKGIMTDGWKSVRLEPLSARFDRYMYGSVTGGYEVGGMIFSSLYCIVSRGYLR